MAARGQAGSIHGGGHVFGLGVKAAIGRGHGIGGGAGDPGGGIDTVARRLDVLGGLGAVIVIVARIRDAPGQGDDGAGQHVGRADGGGSHIGPGRGHVGPAGSFEGPQQRVTVFGPDGGFIIRAGFKELITHFKGVGRHAQDAVGPVIMRAMGGIQFHRLLRTVGVEVGQLAAQGLQPGGVGCVGARPTPGPEDQPGVAVQGDEQALVIGRRRIGITGPAAILENASATGVVHIILNGLGLRLGVGRRALIGFATWVLIFRVPPFKTIVTVQVGAILTRRDAAIIVIGVLTPQIASFSKFASIGVGHGHNMNFAVIQQPGDVGIGAVTAQQIFGQAGGGFGGHIFAGVGFGHQEEAELAAGGGEVFIRQAQQQNIVAGRAASRGFIPTVANIVHQHQVGVGGVEGGEGGLGFFHRAVAGKARNAVHLIFRDHARGGDAGGVFSVHFHGVAGGGQVGLTQG